LRLFCYVNVVIAVRNKVHVQNVRSGQISRRQYGLKSGVAGLGFKTGKESWILKVQQTEARIPHRCSGVQRLLDAWGQRGSWMPSIFFQTSSLKTTFF